MQTSQGMGGPSGGPSGGMNGASLQEIQRLQQQMQYQRQAAGGGSHPNASMGGMSAQHPMQSQSYSQNSQYAAMQAQQQGRGTQMGNTALTMMQHRSSSSGPNPMTGGSSNAASMYGNWTGLQGQQNPSVTAGSTMDASSGSSARLMAMAGMRMNLGGGSGSGNMGGMMDQSSTVQNMQVLLQQQAAQKGQIPLGYATQSQQAQQPSMIAGGAPGMMPDTTAGGTATTQQFLVQQQLANLSKQGVTAAAGMQSASMAGNPLVSAHGSNIFQAQQQHLLQQMQQRGSVNPAMLQHMTTSLQDPSSVNAMGGMVPGMAQHRSSLTGASGRYGMSQQPQPLMTQGSLNEHQLRIHQQNLLRQTSTGHHSVHSDSQESHERSNHSRRASQTSSVQNSRHGMRRESQGQSFSHDLPHHQRHSSMPNMHQQEEHASMSDMQQRHSLMRHSSEHQTSGNVDESAMDRSQHSGGSNRHPTPNPMSSEQGHRPFLDGSFVGGWQSNDDLPDRRRVIFSILEVIRQMRPDTTKMSNKLPHMAKSLEEHLYRSAATKEEYLDFETLKTRLQAIAQGLEVHRTTSTDLGLDESFFGSTMLSQQQHRTQNSSDLHASWDDESGQLSVQLGTIMNQGSQIHQSSSEQGNFADTQHQVPQHDSVNHSGRASTSISQQRNASWGANGPGPAGGSNMMGQTNLTAHGSMNSMSTQQTSHQGRGNNFGALQQDRFSSGGQQQNTSNWGLEGSSMPDASIMDRNVRSPSQDRGASGTVNPDYPDTPKYQDPDAAQKQKVIAQQQQRLLLLRHASKCKAGDSCQTRFCQQMVTLWKHMRTCRDKNCKTSHCLSSRCVLNHYRICKHQGKTATCEVCGPVMAKIRQREKEDESGDPLTSNSQHSATDSHLTAMSSEMLPQSVATGMPSHQNDASTSMGPYQRRQSAGMAQHQNQAEQAQIQQIQAQQLKLQGQLDSLKQLQKQQEQLLKQQSRLQEESQHVKDPSSQQAQQLHQQQMLLHQLQQRCQEQQLLLQQDIQVQSKSAGMSESQQFQAAQQVQPTMAQLLADSAQFQMPLEQSLDQPNFAADRSSEPKKKQRRSSANESKGRRGGKGKQIKGKSLRVEGFSSTESTSSMAKQAEDGSKKRSAVVQTPKEFSQKKSKISIKGSAKQPTSKDETASLKTAAEENTSLVPYMTKASIQRHLESLNKRIRLSSRTVTHKCLPVIQELIDDQFGWVFHDAVDPVALGLPDYFDVVKHPMHLELVKKKLENAIYADMEGFARDVKLVFQNAILYNGESSEVGELAQRMVDKFENLYATVVEEIESSHVHLESKGVLCSLCGTHKRKFEPTVLYCQGKCGMQRIQRHATYFTDRTKANHWCEACYAALDPDELVFLEDGSNIKKKDLQEFKNDALPEEAWVNCDDCGSWVHQVCALFNGRANKSDAKYSCPNCHLAKSDAERPAASTGEFMMGAEHLAHCNMSKAIEKGLETALQTAYEARAEELGVSIEEVEKAEKLAVRVVSNVEKKHSVGDEMIRRYSLDAVQSEFPVRSKCIALFQKIHGVDTLLFALYVYEYGHECPPPNKRRVYISYLDSVKYFEPKCYRTAAYQAVLVEYLRYVKERGFHTAHIWSCPPTPGDDYIFYCHPSHQLIPREDMLRSWYHQMLDKAKAQGIVIRTTTLYDEYFTNDTVDQVPGPRTDPTCLPYFEGDYIAGEIENIIKQLKKHGIEQSGKTDGSPDDVMSRIGHNLGKMKDNFIVVHLRNRRFAAAVERGDDVSDWMEDSDEELVRSKRAKISGKDSSILFPASKQQASPGKLATRPVKLTESSQIESVATAKPYTGGSAERMDIFEFDEPKGKPADYVEQHTPVEESVSEQKPVKAEKIDEQNEVIISVEERKTGGEGTDEQKSGVENTVDPKPVPESASAQKPAAESLDDQKPAVRSTDEPRPVTESTNEQKSSIEGTDEREPGVKNTDEQRPMSDRTMERKPGLENATEQKPAADTADEQEPGVENAEKEKPRAESTDDQKAVDDNSREPKIVTESSDVDKPVDGFTEEDTTLEENAGEKKSIVRATNEQESTAKRRDGEKPDAENTEERKSRALDEERAEEYRTKPEIDSVDNSSNQESPPAFEVNKEDQSTAANQEPPKLTVSGGTTKGEDAGEVHKPPAEKKSDEGDLFSNTKPEGAYTNAEEATGTKTSLTKEYGVSGGSPAVLTESETKTNPSLAVADTLDQKSGSTETKDKEPVASRSAVDDMTSTVNRHVSGLKRPTKTVPDTADDDAPVENDLFESRQLFLNYCQTNHCQFDELRRAKHSTMMVLFQLHNPLAPKFLLQCCACYRDITHGIRYHCNVCSNFDLCQECHKPVTTGLWAQRDARFAHDKSHKFTPIDMEATEETQKSRVERQKALKAHIELLEHAGTCQGAPHCSLQNCSRMKKLFEHVRSCDVKPKKECKICTRLLTLCAMHARKCSYRGDCPIPFCDRIRERNKRLQKQQQLMDDRRRQAQNELYHAGGEAP